MSMKRLKEILAFVQETDLTEVLWEKKGTLIRFERSSKPATASAPAVSLVPEVSSVPEAPAPPAAASVLRSTMVGTFYRSDSAERPPLVVEGTVVNAGQPVAAIEAMKIMKDVVAPQNCRIVKALVANGHAVEYGQPLFEIENV